jgi:hypothetical protein
MLIARAADALPRAPGVYRFRSGARVVYLGRATDLRSRVRSYAGDLRDRAHLRRMVPQVTSVEAVECASVHEAAWLERTLLEESLPRWNRVRGGAEIPCWVTVDADPRTAGIRLTTSPDGTGAAYLGTERTTAFVSGLRRIAPLDLTRPSLLASERDLARAHGVGPDDRGPLSDLLRGVLAREPEAVAIAVSRLRRCRDDAVAEQGYELAARVSSELDALAWATAPQRVVGDHPDATLRAVAGDVEVSFRLSGGRLGSWRVGPRRPTLLRDRDDTPPEWAEFAQKAADLADRLSRIRPAIPYARPGRG